MSSVNKVILIGNLGRDPEVKESAGGQFVTMSIATSEHWKDKATGEKRERTEWHRIVIFNEHLVGVASKYLAKGSKVYVEGALQTRKWTNSEGREQYTTEVVLGKYQGALQMLSGRDGAGREEPPPPDGDVRDAGEVGLGTGDDEIPF